MKSAVLIVLKGNFQAGVNFSSNHLIFLRIPFLTYTGNSFFLAYFCFVSTEITNYLNTEITCKW